MKIIKISLIASAICLLSVLNGCKDKTVVQTVDWYKAHADERKAMLITCKNNPGELMATPNCVNATQADASVTWNARGVPSLGAPLTFPAKNSQK